MRRKRKVAEAPPGAPGPALTAPPPEGWAAPPHRGEGGTRPGVTLGAARSRAGGLHVTGTPEGGCAETPPPHTGPEVRPHGHGFLTRAVSASTPHPASLGGASARRQPPAAMVRAGCVTQEAPAPRTAVLAANDSERCLSAYRPPRASLRGWKEMKLNFWGGWNFNRNIEKPFLNVLPEACVLSRR